MASVSVRSLRLLFKAASTCCVSLSSGQSLASASCLRVLPGSVVTTVRRLHRAMYRAEFHTPVSSVVCVNGVKKMSGDAAGGCTGLLFRQMLEYRSYTYTYLLADMQTKEAVIIDPVIDVVERDCSLVRELGLDLKYAVNTHVHADHITGTGEIKKRIRTCKSVIAAVSKAKGDVQIKEGDFINFGRFKLECYSTPGHTDGCMSYVLRPASMVFTGDALLIRGCGRTDFQQGDAGKLYDSVHGKILSLPRHFAVYPGHDYTGQMSSTVGEELQHNSRLTRTREEFITIMKNLNLPYPKQLDKALPANMVCGVFDEPTA